LGDKPIRLIKSLISRLEHLLVSPWLQRRINRKAKKDYQRDKHKKTLRPFNFAPTKSEYWFTSKADDCYSKE